MAKFIKVEGVVLNRKEIRSVYDYSWNDGGLDPNPNQHGVKVEFRKGGWQLIPGVTADHVHSVHLSS